LIQKISYKRKLGAQGCIRAAVLERYCSPRKRWKKVRRWIYNFNIVQKRKKK
jgi:hypothetical protein